MHHRRHRPQFSQPDGVENTEEQNEVAADGESVGGGGGAGGPRVDAGRRREEKRQEERGQLRTFVLQVMDGYFIH